MLGLNSQTNHKARMRKKNRTVRGRGDTGNVQEKTFLINFLWITVVTQFALRGAKGCSP
jgi:hypothetical protein